MVQSKLGGLFLMDKERKIRRYRQKDYTQVVEFPVEIIGRDGMVRKYSFEESIRLYQRRIASADLRYRDRDVIQAEKQHCLHRIEQLRRSFFAHYGWPEIQMVDEATDEPRVLSAEVAAFLKRCLSSVEPHPQKFNFKHIETSEHYRVYFVQPPFTEDCSDEASPGHFLLYVFRFDSTSGCPARESFFELVKLMDSLKMTPQGTLENLIAFFHTHDCGLILTGNGSLAANIDSKEEIDELEISWAEEMRAPDPVDIAMKMLARGALLRALEWFVEGYTQQHFRRVAYLGAAVVADQIGDDGEAETATVMGCRYFPGDPALIYHRAVNLVRKGNFTEARRTLSQIQNWVNGQGAVMFVVGLCLLADGIDHQGYRMLRRAQSLDANLDPHLATALRWTRSQMWARRLLQYLAYGFAAICGLVGLSSGSILLALGCVALVFTARAVRATSIKQLHRRLQGDKDVRLRLSSSALLMANRTDRDVQ